MEKEIESRPDLSPSPHGHISCDSFVYLVPWVGTKMMKGLLEGLSFPLGKEEFPDEEEGKWLEDRFFCEGFSASLGFLRWWFANRLGFSDEKEWWFFERLGFSDEKEGFFWGGFLGSCERERSCHEDKPSRSVFFFFFLARNNRKGCQVAC
ncbi:hypothetical protein IHE45_01G086700 [Dioscorea alata]|uniref:Uncharacterized protein n=1 Tax=Dioscorea alata TaxID=55571 RepID=A0ACB7WW83_DIOAL|nr:hypothetical protein IHE45_01G086700 [Dioscorea alata]